MTAAEILGAFPTKTALVVGDICLDRWCSYDPALSERSRETGIPRIAVTSTTVTAGGGGTVANNLAALGIGRVAVLGAIGCDGFGQELVEALNQQGISPELMIRWNGLTTFTYTKLINSVTGEEDQPRVDYIQATRLPEAVERQALDHLRTFAGAFDVIIVADQAETEPEGVVTPAMRRMLTDLAAEHPEKVIWADSRVRLERFRRVILKPNRHEAENACRSLFGAVDYPRLRAAVDAPYLFITQGEQGVVVVDSQGETLAPGLQSVKPVDICGAGDSFTAGAALALSISGSPVDAARFGNVVASITVTKRGTGTASPEEVRAAAAHIGW